MTSHLERLRREIADAIAGATESTLTQAPAGKWNSSQILEHLFLSYKNTNRGLAKCVEKSAPLATQRTMKHRFFTFVVTRLGYMPEGFEAPARVVPRGMPPEEVRAAIFAEIETMESGFADCERRFGRATALLDNPRLGPLTADGWRRFHLVHGRHHAKQMRERMNIKM